MPNVIPIKVYRQRVLIFLSVLLAIKFLLSCSICVWLFQLVMHHRNFAFLAAVRSLEEASAAEGVIRCMWYEFCIVLCDFCACLSFIFLQLYHAFLILKFLLSITK